jgi:phosphomannomutase
MTDKYKNEDITTIDGVKIDLLNEWVHLRMSNTEPFIYTEAPSQEQADKLAFIDEIKAVAESNR